MAGSDVMGNPKYRIGCPEGFRGGKLCAALETPDIILSLT